MRGVQRYRSHTRLVSRGKIRWSVEIKETGGTLAHGFARTVKDARDCCRNAQITALQRDSQYGCPLPAAARIQ